jgi:hypothetical protein
VSTGGDNLTVKRSQIVNNTFVGIRSGSNDIVTGFTSQEKTRPISAHSITPSSKIPLSKTILKRAFMLKKVQM